jgi:hypothetical protein
MNMNYPIFQISDEHWNNLHEFDVEYTDKVIITSISKLNQYFLSSEYIDCNGNIFKVTNFRTTGMLSSLFRYIPLIPFSVILIFTDMNKSLSLEGFKAIILKRINEKAEYNDFKTIVLKSQTFAEAMGDQG